jgi:hypothetical protein
MHFEHGFQSAFKRAGPLLGRCWLAGGGVHAPGLEDTTPATQNEQHELKQEEEDTQFRQHLSTAATGSLGTDGRQSPRFGKVKAKR